MPVPAGHHVVKKARSAEEFIAAAAEDGAKAVKGDIEAHHKVWEAKGKDEQATLTSQALLWAARQNGHRVDCPACNSRALVFGRAVAAAIRKLEDDLIVEKQEYLPTHFECIACGLKINTKRASSCPSARV